jgi:hypothetical protein
MEANHEEWHAPLNKQPGTRYSGQPEGIQKNSNPKGVESPRLWAVYLCT